jgi:hypothetical protein
MVRPLVVACGALATELRSVLRANDLDDIEVRYLSANLHNVPGQIVPTLRPILAEAARSGRPVFVGYADCGTGGLLDTLLAEFPGTMRLPGAHCYEMFAGSERFAAMHNAEPGTFYLTDFLAKHFEPLVWQGLGLDRHPQLLPTYFAGYRRVVLLAQDGSDEVRLAAERAAARLGLALEIVATGLGSLGAAVQVSFSASGAR